MRCSSGWPRARRASSRPRRWGSPATSRVVSLGDESLTALLAEELRIRSRDLAFERALAGGARVMSGRTLRRHRAGHHGPQPRAEHRVARCAGRGLEPGTGMGRRLPARPPRPRVRRHEDVRGACVGARAAAPDPDDDSRREAGRSDDREAPAGARSRRRPDRRRELLVRGHAPPRGSAAPGRHPLRRLRRLGRRGRRAIRPVDHAGRIGRRVGTDQGRARGDRRADRGGSVRHARRPRRRRALRQDGPQRHRVRRHAAHRRGLGRAAPRARPERPGDGRRLRRMEPRPARVLPRRADGDGSVA